MPGSDVSGLKSLFYQCMPLFIALGDEKRLTIIEALTDDARRRGDLSGENLRRHGMNVSEITRKTSLSRPAVSHHLKILKTAGLISSRQEGTCIYYYLSIEEGTKRLMLLGNELQEILHFDTEA